MAAKLSPSYIDKMCKNKTCSVSCLSALVVNNPGFSGPLPSAYLVVCYALFFLFILMFLSEVLAPACPNLSPVSDQPLRAQSALLGRHRLLHLHFVPTQCLCWTSPASLWFPPRGLCQTTDLLCVHPVYWEGACRAVTQSTMQHPWQTKGTLHFCIYLFISNALEWRCRLCIHKGIQTGVYMVWLHNSSHTLTQTGAMGTVTLLC